MEQNNKKFLKYVLSIALFIVVVYFLFKYHRKIVRINIHELRRFILSYGKFSSLIFVLLYTLKPIVIIIPASLLSILAGTVFGPFKAIILNMIGCFGAATVGFFLSRLLGRSFVDKILKNKTVNLDSNIEKHGFKIMFFMRLSLVFHYDGLSYAAGLSKMKYKDFILGTVLGVFPEMVVYSFMGKNMHKPLSPKFLFPIILMILLAAGGLYLYKKFNKPSNT